MAISLAAKAKSRDERLAEADEAATLAEAELTWTSFEGAGHTKEELAAIIYKRLHEKDASKAIAAQYAAQLVCTGKYGTGEVLFKALPPYLQAALSHVTIAPVAKLSATAGSGAVVSTELTVPGTAAAVSSSTLLPVPAALPSGPSASPITVPTVHPPRASPGGTQGNGE